MKMKTNWAESKGAHEGCVGPRFATVEPSVILFSLYTMSTVLTKNRKRFSFHRVQDRNITFPSQWRIQDFPEEGTPTPGGHQHTILPNFPKNCMKLKELGPQGVTRPRTPLRSATAFISLSFVSFSSLLFILEMAAPPG